jgi:hypothetical protein
MKSFDFFKPYLFTIERDTHKGAKQLIFIFLVAKICEKVPFENIHGEASVLENFQKKRLNHHISRREKKKSFEIATF